MGGDHSNKLLISDSGDLSQRAHGYTMASQTRACNGQGRKNSYGQNDKRFDKVCVAKGQG